MVSINSESYCFISMLDLLPGISLQDSIEISQNYKSMFELCNSIKQNTFEDNNFRPYLQSHLSNDSLQYLSMLCYIPNIDMIQACQISEHFPSMVELCNAFTSSNPKMLSKIIGDERSELVYNYLFKTSSKNM